MCALLLLSAGCASVSGIRQSDGESIVHPQSLDRIVSDLSFVMVQLLEPQTHTIQFKPDPAPLGTAVLEKLKYHRYGLQKVSADQGAHFLGYYVVALAEADGDKQYRYTLRIGNASVERHYVDLGDKIYPSTPVVVRGISASRSGEIQLDGELFDVLDQDLAYLFNIEYRDPPVVAVPRITLITNELVADIATTTIQNPEAVGVNAANMEVTNLYFTNESNFSDATRGYRTVRRDVIIFDNDSMRLGDLGKSKVRRVAQLFDQERDYIQLLGCSNGRTKLDIGNEGLALGRAKRVVEEFVALGIAKSSLLDEGCWAPENLDGRFPRRGVVVELKRR